MAKHAYEPLPRLSLLVAQGTRQVGHDDELMGKSALPKGAATDLDAPLRPGAFAAGKEGIDDAARLAFKKCLQPQLGRRTTDHALRRLPNESLTGAVDQTQRTILVERENGDVDLLHHLLQERDRFEGAVSLVPQRLAERVDLMHRLPECVVEAAAAGTNRVVALA